MTKRVARNEVYRYRGITLILAAEPGDVMLSAVAPPGSQRDQLHRKCHHRLAYLTPDGGLNVQSQPQPRPAIAFLPIPYGCSRRDQPARHSHGSGWPAHDRPVARIR